MKDFSKRLREAILLEKTTQSELSQKTGISKSAISQYCAGSFAPKKDRVQVIAKALNISPDWLMGADVPMYERITECRECGVRYDTTNPEDLSFHNCMHERWKEAAEMFGFFWPRKRCEEETARAKNLIDSGNLSDEEYAEAQIVIFKALFSQSLDSFGMLFYEHIAFEHYVASLLNQEEWQRKIPPHIFKKLVDRYGVIDLIPQGNRYDKAVAETIRNTVTLSGRDGTVVFKYLNDQQFSAVKTLVEQLPETE